VLYSSIGVAVNPRDFRTEDSPPHLHVPTTPFKDEPLTSARAENARNMKAALTKVRAELGRESWVSVFTVASTVEPALSDVEGCGRDQCHPVNQLEIEPLDSRCMRIARLLFESSDRLFEFFVKSLTHEHDVGNARAHVNGEKMLVQDTGDDTMQQAGFDCNPSHGIALLEPFLTVFCRSLFVIVGDHIWTSLDSLREFLNHQPDVI